MSSITCRAHLLASATLGTISVVGLLEHLSGFPAVTMSALTVLSFVDPITCFLLPMLLGWLSYRFDAFRIPFFIVTSFLALTVVSTVGLLLEVPLISLFTVAWAAPSLGVAITIAFGGSHAAPIAFGAGAVAQVITITVLAMMGAETWALAALIAHGFFMISASTFMVAWMEDNERAISTGEFSEFYLGTFVMLVCLSIFVVVVLPVLYRASKG